ncbi:hypothetical protein KC318_g4678 [Hortaea werneckii]|nr:hypothetical protein KC334_g5965 [Hortaea werneckii]KAI7669426.1 hypothetical protein KC318_g4678 [Hortaea werneckii]
MAPKVNCNPIKLASIVTYLQKSRTAYSIKDLEKVLPQVASINGMQVKDYLQSLSDENKINVEKIGSGNWYWSFASQDKKTREQALSDAQVTHEKANAINHDLKQKIAEAQAQRADEEDMLDDCSKSREELKVTKHGLETETTRLRNELAAYSDVDPTELEQKRTQTETMKRESEEYTDHIYAMDGWFKEMLNGDGEALTALRMNFFADEYDEEAGNLKEVS